MATVSKKFRDDFELWAADRIAGGDFSLAEMDEFRDMLRRDVSPGPDQLRAGIVAIIAPGVEIPAAIDDHEERYSLWEDYFAAEAAILRNDGMDSPVFSSPNRRSRCSWGWGSVFDERSPKCMLLPLPLI